MKEYKQIKKILDKSASIGIISHVNPDADNIGSISALSRSLRLYGKDVKTICVDTVPYNLEFIEETKNFVTDYDYDFDLLFVLDCSGIDRLGRASSVIDNSNFIINIDHHISNNLKGNINIVEKTASSTGEVLFKILKDLELPLDIKIGESIYTAISGDSGSFRYDTVSSDTFRIAAELLDLGIDADKINLNLYGKMPLSKVKLSNRALDRMVIDEDLKLAYTYVCSNDFKELNASDADIEGIVEYIRDIKCVEISILLRETSYGFKASARSKSYYNVAELAHKFGGGGHIRAAGFSLEEKDIDNIIKKIIKEI